MRLTLQLVTFLALGLLGVTDALCNVDSGTFATCHKLDDIKYIDAYNLTSLSAPVREKTLTPIPFKKLSSSLRSLDLSGGDVEFIESGTFLKMKYLEDLRMSDNSISQLKDSTIEGLKKLKYLNLRRNDIRQLPSALTKLEALRNLEISGNPLACDCATLRVRDQLLAKSVKISNKVYCLTPSHLKGVSLLKPEAEVICMFEEQDNEMQADEAGSGDDYDDENDEFSDDIESSTDVPPLEEKLTSSKRVLETTDAITELVTDDLIVPVLTRSGVNEMQLTKDNSTKDSSNLDSSNTSSPATNVNDDFEFDTPEDIFNDDLIVEGSGLTEGSGWEGSGMDDLWKPVDPSHFAKSLEDETLLASSTTEQPTTSSASWFDVIWSTFGLESDATTPSDDTDAEKGVTEEEFIEVRSTKAPETVEKVTDIQVQEESTTSGSINMNKVEIPDLGIPREEVVTKKVELLGNEVVPSADPNLVKNSEKQQEDFTDNADDEDIGIDDAQEASTGETHKSTGSYVVLGALLGVLGALIGFAAYKSSLCKKKPNNDPERGTELKDMQKSLLDGNNTNQPKISSNGNTENAPLVEPTRGNWAEPQEVKRWPDSDTSTVDNGKNYTPPVVESDPVKPPRKSLPTQDDSNGLEEVKTHSPLSTFAPKTHGASLNSVTPPNSPTSPIDEGKRSPPLSPNTQRVKITLQENPDSVPKTPILITRTKPGVNLVKSP